MPRLARMVLLVAAVLLAAEFVHAAFGVGSSTVFDDYLYDLVDLVAAGLILGRGFARREDRAAWLLLGAGVLAWTAGDVLWTFVLGDDTTSPSIADAAYLAFYPLAFVAI